MKRKLIAEINAPFKPDLAVHKGFDAVQHDEIRFEGRVDFGNQLALVGR